MIASHLGGIAVDAGDDLEGPLVEAQVAGQGAPQVAHADDHQLVVAVEAEEVVEVGGQLVDVVADAADAEAAELGEVLADLGGGEEVAAGQLLRGDPPQPLGLELAQAAEVDREPVEGEG